MDDSAQVELRRATCSGCGATMPPVSRVTHFLKRFCSAACGLKWRQRRWRADSLVVRRYYFHYLKFHPHPTTSNAALMESPCSMYGGHERAMDNVAAFRESTRTHHRCAQDDVAPPGPRLAMDVELGPTLAESCAALDDPARPQYGQPGYEEFRFLSAAHMEVATVLLKNTCSGAELIRPPRKQRIVKERNGNRNAPGTLLPVSHDERERWAQDLNPGAPLERVVAPDEKIEWQDLTPEELEKLRNGEPDAK